MTDCEKKSMMQVRPLHCNKDPSCPQESFVTFQDEKLRQQVSHLQSKLSHELMHNTFKDLFAGIQSMTSVESDDDEEPKVKKTEFNNPPVPRTKVPESYTGGPPKVWV